MYESVKSRAKNHYKVSAVFSSHIGVRQGNPLSPFLFSMFINDLEENMRVKGCSGLTISDLKLWLMLYADDTVILWETSAGLQESLDLMYDYCELWKLYLNVDKSKIVVFRKGGQLGRDDHWFYGDSYIDVLNSFNYLDVTLSYTGSFAVTQQTLASQATKAVFSLQKATFSLYNPDANFMYSLFDKLVAPILHYGCEVWGFHKAEAVERVHLRFCKTVLRLKSSTANYFVYGELDRAPLIIELHLRILKYWTKIISRKLNPLVCSMYRFM